MEYTYLKSVHKDSALHSTTNFTLLSFALSTLIDILMM